MARQQLRYGPQLYAGVFPLPQVRVEQAGGRRFAPHGGRRLFQGDEQAQGRFFPAPPLPRRSRAWGAETWPPLTWTTILWGVRRGPSMKYIRPSTPRSAPRLRSSCGWASSRRHGPILELVGVLLPQGAGAPGVLRLAYDFVVPARLQVEGRLEPVFHQGHRQVGDVDANPAPPQFLRRRHRRAAAAEGVEDQVAPDCCWPG